MSATRELLGIALAAADAAAEVILGYCDGERRSECKPDGTPVTDADRAADACIRSWLEGETSLPVVSEESAESHAVPADGVFWLVDPLDGTKEFVRKSGEFTVNIALIEAGAPRLGVVAAPLLRAIYFAAEGAGAFRRAQAGGTRPIRVGACGERLRIAVSRDHIGEAERALLRHLAADEGVPAGSSLKFCLLAEGKADLYPRFGRTMEWDTAAGQCVLEQAGGGVAVIGGGRLGYGKPGLENPDFIAYSAGVALDAALAAASW